MAEKTYPQQVEPMYYEDEIDLRAYINVVIRQWRFIVIATLLAALGAGFSTMLQARQYEATALVAVSTPRYAIRFNSETEALTEIDLTDQQPLATSDQLLQELQLLLDSDLTVGQLRGMLNAENVKENTRLIELKAMSDDPEEAAEIVNQWATLFTGAISDFYSVTSNQVTSLNEQLEVGLKERQTAEQALIAFESQNQTPILQAQLDSLQSIYTASVNQEEQIRQIILDIEGFRAQLATLPTDGEVELGDELTALFLQLKAFNSEESASLLQLQEITPESLSNKKAGEIITSLDELINVLQEKAKKISAPLSQLETEILELQGRIQTINTERAELDQKQQIAQNTYTLLATKVEEVKLVANLSTGEVKIVSQASVPESPVSRGTLRNIALAAVVGLMMGVVMAFLIEYMREKPAEGKQVTQE